MTRHRTQVRVLEDSGDLQFWCSCGERGTVFLQSSGLSAAMHAAQAEADAHLAQEATS